MTQIEITMLGTTAGIPTPNRNHAAIYVRYHGKEEYCCLWDCGEGTQRQIFRSGVNFMRLSDVFISHWHADHFAGLLGLLFTMNMEKRKEQLNIFGPEAEKWVDNILNLGYAKLTYPVKKRDVWHEGTEIQTLVDETEFMIQATPAKHGVPAAAFAFVEKPRIKLDKEKLKKLGLPDRGKVYQKLKDDGTAMIKGRKIALEDVSFAEAGKKVVYSGDTLPSKNIVKLAKGADLLIHDSTFFEEDEDKDWKHSTVDQVLAIATEANVKQLLLTHISRRYQNYEELQKYISGMKNVSIAHDLMKVVI